MRTPQEIWDTALGELQLQVNKPNYNTWLKDTKGIECRSDVFVIGAPNAFVAEWLENRLLSLIKKTLSGIIGSAVEVQFLEGVHNLKRLAGRRIGRCPDRKRDRHGAP